MKKLVVAVATVFVAAAVLAGGVAAKGDGGKLVASGFACNVVDGDGDLFVTFASEQWLYQNQAILRCSGFGDPYLGPAPPKFWNTTNWPPPGGGGLCGTFFGVTSDWQDKVGRAGNSQLTCTVTFDDPPASTESGAKGVG